MRVAYVVPHLIKPSGWRTFSIGVISTMQKYIEPTLFVAAEDYSTALDLFPVIPKFELPVTQQASLRSLGGSLKLIRAYLKIRQAIYPHFDLVHSLEAYPTGLVGDWIATQKKCPHVITAHGTYAIVWRNYPIDRKVYQRVLSKSSKVCPVSRGTAELLHTNFNKVLNENKIHPILNGNDYYKKVSSKDALNRIFPTNPVFLSVGEIKPRKGQLTSLQAFGLLSERYPEACYWIVGNYRENEYYTCIKNFIAKKKLQNVKIFGRISDEELHECYQKASIFVLSPEPENGSRGFHVEGFGLVYLEAGAYGLPVIGTLTGGIPDAVRNGETGLLVAPGDVGALSQAMLQLVANPEMARRMGKANRQWAETLTWERFAKEQTEVYQQILSSS